VIYLASPYSHQDPAVREARFRAACDFTHWMLKQEHHVFSPIAYSHQFTMPPYTMDGPFEVWKEIDLDMIARCEAVMVLKIDGWDQSRGVKAEIEYAKEIGKRVIYQDWPKELDLPSSKPDPWQLGRAEAIGECKRKASAVSRDLRSQNNPAAALGADMVGNAIGLVKP
jgi:hypothetical protein